MIFVGTVTFKYKIYQKMFPFLIPNFLKALIASVNAHDWSKYWS